MGQSQGKLFYLNKTKFQFSDVNKKYYFSQHQGLKQL